MLILCILNLLLYEEDLITDVIWDPNFHELQKIGLSQRVNEILINYIIENKEDDFL